LGKESSKENQQGITFEGGSGDSVQDPIVIKGASSHELGVVAEYKFIAHKYGRRDVAWKLKMQMVSNKPKMMDLIRIELSDGSIKDIYFDISDFFGKK
jgi:hypothetical protein